MNETSAPPPLPSTPAAPNAVTCMPGGTGVGAAMETLLKSPSAALFEFTQGQRAGGLILSLILIIAAGLGLFGVVAVDFSHGIQWWAAPLKMIAGLFLSALLCLPSLYIFTCLGGLDIRFKTAIGLLLTALALTCLILAGFTPVIWVFSQSSDSIPFMGAVMVLIWSISLFFGLKLLSAQARALGMIHSLDLRLWMIIFVLVTLQMSCALRPLLGDAASFLPTEKKFFLQHWAQQLHDTSPAPTPSALPAERTH
jgi:hypothetical protein